eukprot:TRINITY_DN1783_c0_g1_i3.p1 TRINITY_DN1783_c0_g1~~TRINITY_DN1783_c0_g1_i3.p1  ORF type:complete len:119 (-),score=34.82 TRINITY_DN1783_c0_g1_i3:203-511(-)
MLTKREQVIPDEEAGDDAGVDDADADFEEDAPAPATKKARPSEHDASAEVAPKAKISMQPNSAIKLDVPADQQDAVMGGVSVLRVCGCFFGSSLSLFPASSR